MADAVVIDNKFTFSAPVVLAFAKDLFVPKAFAEHTGKPQGDPKYRGQFVIATDHPDWVRLKDFVIGMARKQWPNGDLGAKDMQGNSLILWPWRDGNKEADKRWAKAKLKDANAADRYENIRGKVILNTSSVQAPDYVGIENGKPVRYEGDRLKQVKDKLFFSGAEVVPSIALVARDGNDAIKSSVTAYLNGVLGTGKGTRIGGGRPDVETVFAGYVGHAVEANPLDDAIPF
jgi:hypothetical protein